MKIPNYTVLKDTREQSGWTFQEYDKCSGMELSTLHTGDYTIKGFEEVVCIERKASTLEIAGNLGKNKNRFHNEMKRMQEFPFAFLVLEFSASDLINYPCNVKLSRQQKSRIRVTGKYLLKSILEFQIWYLEFSKILVMFHKQNPKKYIDINYRSYHINYHIIIIIKYYLSVII